MNDIINGNGDELRINVIAHIMIRKPGISWAPVYWSTYIAAEEVHVSDLPYYGIDIHDGGNSRSRVLYIVLYALAAVTTCVVVFVFVLYRYYLKPHLVRKRQVTTVLSTYDTSEMAHTSKPTLAVEANDRGNTTSGSLCNMISWYSLMNRP